MKLKMIKVLLAKEVGEISNEKSTRLRENLTTYYPEKVDVPTGFILLNPAEKKLFYVMPSQIGLQFDGDDIKPSCSEITTILSTTLSALLADPKSKWLLELIGHYESTRTLKNSFRSLKSDVVQKLLDDLKGIKGAGYRFLIETEQFKGDFYVEPFVKNDQYAFVRLNVALLEELDPEGIASKVEEVVSLFKSDFLKVAHEIL